MSNPATLTADRLREVLDYDQETGVFRWRSPSSNRVRVGAVAGRINRGRVEITIDRVSHQANRLAWLHVTGSWPSGDVDHMDGDRSNNTFRNLRDVSHQTNLQNARRARSDNKLGILGVCRARGKYQAGIKLNGKFKFLGYFDTPEAAHSAYVAEKRQIHAGCTL